MSTSVFRPGALAVISGSASGIGFAFASHCRRQGMHLALIDINGDALSKAKSALASLGDSSSGQTETYAIDVADLSAWSKVKDDVASTFKAPVDFLLLNAGTSVKTTTSQPYEDVAYFQKTLAVNLFGVVNGLATFLPSVQQSSGPSAIVVTGSKQGITNPPGNPAYNSSKSAIKTITEQLSHDLRTQSSPSYAPHVSAHLLVPGWTYTGLSGNLGPVPDEEALQKKPRGAWLPSQVAEYGVNKINKGKFYIICPDTDVDEALDIARMQYAIGDITEGRSALSRWDERFKDEAAKVIAENAAARRK